MSVVTLRFIIFFLQNVFLCKPGSSPGFAKAFVVTVAIPEGAAIGGDMPICYKSVESPVKNIKVNGCHYMSWQ